MNSALLIVAACIFASLVAHVVACYGWWAWRRHALALEAHARARNAEAAARAELAELMRPARCDFAGCELCADDDR